VIVDMKLTNSLSALALYRYEVKEFGAVDFEVFYSAFLTILTNAGLKPTYVSIDGEGYRGGFTKVGSKSHKKMLETRFAGITTLSLAVNPVDSSEPAYDSFAAVSVSFVRETEELLSYVMMDEAFMPFASSSFHLVLRQLTELQRWSFGYGFRAPSSRRPDFYILGLDPGNLAAEERRALRAWYASTPKDRLKRIRNVYEFNVLGNLHLEQTLPTGKTLREFVEHHTGSKTTSLQAASLLLWEITSGQELQSTRTFLHQAGLCIE
jgi:hypothetical protein